MKRSLYASRRTRSGDAVRVSLFPFLAVLICTMGALILLLIVIVRQGRIQAAEINLVETSEQRQDIDRQMGMVQWEIEALADSRKNNEARLTEARLELGGIEDHSRQLRGQIEQFLAAWDELEKIASDEDRHQHGIETELAALEARIAESQRRLAEAEEELAGRRQSYSVVPYQGPNETLRRPIYLECFADRIVLQPEGIVFGSADFIGSLGPGNPLDAALRGTREFLLRQQQIGSAQLGEPYPLLLVRPEGIEAYYIGRAALSSWGSDFGYELIGADWDLDFPPPAPGLTQAVIGDIQRARVRQQLMAQANPRHSGRGGSGGRLVASAHGGFIREGGNEDEPTSRFEAGKPSQRFGNRFDSPGGSTPEGMTGQGTGVPSGSAQVAMIPQGTSEQPGPGQPAGETPVRLGEWSPQAESGEKGQPGEARPPDRPTSLAATRGQDWGLPNAARGSVSITCPIRIDCYPDRLVLVPEEGLTGVREVAFSGRTEEAIDEFVSAVWDYMDSWGIAGNGMYWRPVLDVHVAPDGDLRFADLKALLDGSGLEVARK